MAVPVPMRSAVKMSGRDAGTTTCRYTSKRDEPSERTESTLASGTAFAASRAVTRIWKKTISAISAILGRLPRPISTSSTGKNTTLGMG